MYLNSLINYIFKYNEKLQSIIKYVDFIKFQIINTMKFNNFAMYEELPSVFATNNNVVTLIQSLNTTNSQDLCALEND